MYRIRLYIVPEQDEDDSKEDFSSGFVDKELLSSKKGCWWDTAKGDGRVTVTHRTHKAKVEVTFSESQEDRDQETGRCGERRNNRNNSKNKVGYIRVFVFVRFGYLANISVGSTETQSHRFS
jgi:hypothetical protein